MNHLSCRYGAGDTYLVAALWKAYEALHGPAAIICKPEHADIPQMFGARYEVDPEPQQGLVVHPEHIPGGGMADALTARPDFSQADMYRALLGLPWSTPLEKPQILPEWGTRAEQALEHFRNGSNKRPVLLMPLARSWPIPSPMEFWRKLADALHEAGFLVLSNRADLGPNAPMVESSLGPTYALARKIGWAIGANAGGFVALVSAELVGRKTLITPGPAQGSPVQFNRHFALASAYPFAHQFKFDGHYYDIEEHEIFEDSSKWDETIARILSGPHAKQTAPERPKRIPKLRVPMSPGDVADRTIIAELKANRLSDPEARRTATNEMTMLSELWNAVMAPQIGPLVAAKIDELQREHSQAWPQVQAVYDALNKPEIGAADRLAAYGELSRGVSESNKRRVQIRGEIDAMLGGIAEVKSYGEKVA